MIDLEPLVGQYDPGMILVGPLLRPWSGFGYYYFQIAGHGRHIYQSIDLGIVEAEAEAQRQRAEAVDILQSRFAGVISFGSRLEMAHAVYERWPNRETAKILALAAKSAALPTEKPPSRNGSYESLDACRDAVVLPGAYAEQTNWSFARPRTLASVALRFCTVGGVIALLGLAIVSVPASMRFGGGEPVRADAQARPARGTPVGDASLTEKEAILPVPSRSTEAIELPREDELPARAEQILPLSLWSPKAHGAAEAAPQSGPKSLYAPGRLLEQAKPQRLGSPPRQAQLEGRSTPPAQPLEVESPEADAAFAFLRAHPPAVPLSRAAQSDKVDPAWSIAVLKAVPRLSRLRRHGAHDKTEPAPAVTQPPTVPLGIAVGDEPSQVVEPASSTTAPAPLPTWWPPSAQARAAGEPAPDVTLALPFRAAQGNEPRRPVSPVAVDPSLLLSPMVENLLPPTEPSSEPNWVTELTQQIGPATLVVKTSPPNAISAQVETGISVPSLTLLPPSGSRSVQLSVEEITTLLNRGMYFLKSGDLVSARLVLQRAAQARSASAAVMLGATFDPLIIQQHNAVVGIAPNVDLARYWYEKAVELGSRAAAKHLAILAQIGH